MKSGWLIFGIIGAVVLFLLYRASSSTTTVTTTGAAIAGPSSVPLIPLTSSALGAIGNVLGQSQSDSTDDGADFDLSEASSSSSDTFDL
jgi:hypothetical protein